MIVSAGTDICHNTAACVGGRTFVEHNIACFGVNNRHTEIQSYVITAKAVCSAVLVDCEKFKTGMCRVVVSYMKRVTVL